MTRYRDSNANGANNPCLHFESRVEERNFFKWKETWPRRASIRSDSQLRATTRWFSHKGGKNCRRWRKKTRFSYLQDTVISTLVAGIEALTGSKSPMDAMFAKVGICNFPLWLPLLPRSCPLSWAARRRAAECWACVYASSARSRAKVRGRGREAGRYDVTPVFLLLWECVCIASECPPPPRSFAPP